MQNKCRNTDAGFVSLEDCGWRCAGCGGWNSEGCSCCRCGCDRCSSCVCGRCGESGRVYARAARNDRCGKQASRSHDCGCAGAQNCTRDVPCCEHNTSIRSISDNGCEKCSGSTCTHQNRSADCGCDNGCEKCSSGTCTHQNRSADCVCDNGNGDSAYGRKNRGVGMVWAAEQELDRIFESESALRTGTLFPELHKPLNGYCPAEGNCADACQGAAFAAWELRLYLNTHPDDKQALALFRKICSEMCDPSYATSFLDGECCTSCWDWVKDPWPWECGANGK